MKQIVFTSMLIAITTILCQAQISLEQNYAVSNGSNLKFQSVLLESVGTKYAFYDVSNLELKLYNLDHSIYKTITVNNPSANLYDPANIVTSYDEIMYVKEGLFDTDGEIEFMLFYIVEGTSAATSARGVAIINEDGSVLFNKVGAFPNYITFGGDIIGKNCIVKASNNTTKMVLIDSTGYNVYSLPGTLMCDPCGGVTGARSTERAERVVLNQNVPNPSSTYTIIGYELPEDVTTGTLKIYNNVGIELKSYQIDKAFDHLRISTNDLPAGTYYYSVITDKGQVQSKKMVVIK